jgi:hypothetical protein
MTQRDGDPLVALKKPLKKPIKQKRAATELNVSVRQGRLNQLAARRERRDS